MTATEGEQMLAKFVLSQRSLTLMDPANVMELAYDCIINYAVRTGISISDAGLDLQHLIQDEPQWKIVEPIVRRAILQMEEEQRANGNEEGRAHPTTATDDGGGQDRTSQDHPGAIRNRPATPPDAGDRDQAGDPG